MDSANDLTTSSGWFFPTWILLAWFLRSTSWPAEILVFDDLCFELTFSFPVFYEHVSVDLPSSPIRKLRNIAIRWLHWHRKKHNTLWVPEEKQIGLQKNLTKRRPTKGDRQPWNKRTMVHVEDVPSAYLMECLVTWIVVESNCFGVNILVV